MGYRSDGSRNFHSNSFELSTPYSPVVPANDATNLCTYLDVDDTMNIHSTECAKTEDVPANTRVRGLCQYSSCVINATTTCAFPFRFKGRLYDSCITLGSRNRIPWCAIDVELNKDMKDNAWAKCPSHCYVNNCPIGYYRAYPDQSCIKV